MTIFNPGIYRWTPKNPGLPLLDPPGTGKSSMLHILSSSLELHIVRVDPSTVLREFIGRSEQNLAKVLELQRTTSSALSWLTRLREFFDTWRR